jgi:hypothetical protein
MSDRVEALMSPVRRPKLLQDLCVPSELCAAPGSSPMGTIDSGLHVTVIEVSSEVVSLRNRLRNQQHAFKLLKFFLPLRLHSQPFFILKLTTQKTVGLRLHLGRWFACWLKQVGELLVYSVIWTMLKGTRVNMVPSASLFLKWQSVQNAWKPTHHISLSCATYTSMWFVSPQT